MAVDNAVANDPAADSMNNVTTSVIMLGLQQMWDQKPKAPKKPEESEEDKNNPDYQFATRPLDVSM